MSVKARVSTGVFMNENDLISSYQEPSNKDYLADNSSQGYGAVQDSQDFDTNRSVYKKNLAAVPYTEKTQVIKKERPQTPDKVEEVIIVKEKIPSPKIHTSPKADKEQLQVGLLHTKSWNKDMEQIKEINSTDEEEHTLTKRDPNKTTENDSVGAQDHTTL